MSVSWLFAGLVRMLVQASLVGISIPLFSTATTLAAAAEASGYLIQLYNACIVALISALFAALVWVVSKKAAALAGRGMALAIAAGEVYGPIASVAQGAGSTIAPATAAVIRGTSQLIHSLRRAA